MHIHYMTTQVSTIVEMRITLHALVWVTARGKMLQVVHQCCLRSHTDITNQTVLRTGLFAALTMLSAIHKLSISDRELAESLDTAGPELSRWDFARGWPPLGHTRSPCGTQSSSVKEFVVLSALVSMSPRYWSDSASTGTKNGLWSENIRVIPIGSKWTRW